MNVIIIPSIVIISYLVTEFFKIILKVNKKFLPVISGLAGGCIGIVAYFAVPSLLDGFDILSAIAIGIVSGLTATGSNELIKNLLKK